MSYLQYGQFKVECTHEPKQYKVYLLDPTIPEWLPVGKSKNTFEDIFHMFRYYGQNEVYSVGNISVALVTGCLKRDYAALKTVASKLSSGGAGNCF